MVNFYWGCNQIWRKFQESTKQYYFLLTFLGAILHQFARKEKMANPKPCSPMGSYLDPNCNWTLKIVQASW
jgi:hypothetical protein